MVVRLDLYAIPRTAISRADRPISHDPPGHSVEEVHAQLVLERAYLVRARDDVYPQMEDMVHVLLVVADSARVDSYIR